MSFSVIGHVIVNYLQLITLTARIRRLYELVKHIIL